MAVFLFLQIVGEKLGDVLELRDVGGIQFHELPVRFQTGAGDFHAQRFARLRFQAHAAIAEAVLVRADIRFTRIAGDWSVREAAVLAEIEDGCLPSA